MNAKFSSNTFNVNYIQSKLSDKYTCELNNSGNRIHISNRDKKLFSMIITGHLVAFIKPNYPGFRFFSKEQAQEEHRGNQIAEIEIKSVDEGIKIINEILK